MSDSWCDVDVDLMKGHGSGSITLKELSEFIKTEMSDVFDVTHLSTNSSAKTVKTPVHNRLLLETINNRTVFNFTSGVYPNGYKTSDLIRAYMHLDQRAKILAFALRYLAKV